MAAWTFTGQNQALAESGASWFYTWSTSAQGISAPHAGFVPMIWGSGSVTSSALAQAKQSTSCGCVLGFNEPDNSGQSNMTPAQALALWPQLQSTGLELGSPAVATGAADSGGWLDQFMSGAKQDGYRVDFITLHWYGSDFDPGAAAGQLQSYIEAVYAKYHLPIWLTEFALIGFSGGGEQYPSESVQAAFLTQATAMLDKLSYVQRYAWFGLPATSALPNTGPFQAGPVVTPVGTAFEAAHRIRYTADTLALVRAKNPGVDFVWIIGADALRDFHRWQRWRQIMLTFPIAVIDRPGATLSFLSSIAVKTFDYARVDERDAPLLARMKAPAWTFIHGPRSSLSSSAIRKIGKGVIGPASPTALDSK